MYKETISQKQAILLMTTFIIGSSTILGVGEKSKQDVWIAVIISMAAASVIMAVYARIIKLFPETDLFGLLNKLYGKIPGRIIALIFTWYVFHVEISIIRNISEFIRIVSLDATPQCVIALMTGIVIAYAIKCGIEVTARWVSIFFPLLVTVTLILTVLAMNAYDFNRLKPILYEGFKPVISDAFFIFSLPFAETVAFLGIAGCLQKKSSPYKIYNYSLLIGGVYLVTLAVRTILLLGPGNTDIQMFPIYIAARLIKIGDFFQRIELINAVVIVSCMFTKAAVYMFSITKGMSYILNIKDYRLLSSPLVFFTAAYSIVLYNNAVEMIEWAARIFPYYAIPFQIILPVIIWITAEIKARNANNNSVQNQNLNSAKSDSSS